MAPRNADVVSSDEDDAPESVSLTQSRQHIKARDDELKKIQIAERDKKRARNKERDRKLKEQAENSKRRKKEAHGSDPDLVARMERAMEEAQMEMDDDDESEGGGSDGQDDENVSEDDEEDSDDYDEEEEFKGIQESSDNSDDEDMSSSDAESSHSATKIKAHPNYLPDHLFSSAFNSQTSKAASKRKAKEDGDNVRSRKRVRSTALPKDVIIGGRAIRVLKQGGPPSAIGMIPHTKAKKFVDRSLGLKGGKTRTRGWERRPANIGVMRRNGPAASFVRNR